MPEPFTLQLHITDRCQLRCRHCYRDASHDDLPVASLLRIVDDFAAFCQSRDLPGRLTLAGGEPLLRYDDLLALTRHATAANLQVHLLTNGLLLTADRIAELRAAGLVRTQISVDGDEPAHDGLRGQGVYRQTLAALHLLRDYGMWSTISVTLGQWNHHCLAHLIRLAGECHAKIFISRFVPCGTGLALQDQMLTAAQWKKVMRTCHRLIRSHPAGVALRDPLYSPLIEPGPNTHACIGGCSIGHGGLAVDSDGTAYPCRRLPIPLGNVLTDSLDSIWSHPALESLRNRDALEGACGQCRWRWRCGGCRAIAHGLTANPLAADPQCPHTTTRRSLLRLHRRK